MTTGHTFDPKDETKTLVKFLILSCLALLGILLTFSVQSTISPNNACENSPYQHLYNNATGSVVRWFGECHTTSNYFYKEEVDCRGGFLGIGQSCVVREHYKFGSYNICYKLKTGEIC